MGYTHYWIPKKVSDEKWNDFYRTVIVLHKNLPATTNSAGGYYANEPLKICDGMGMGKPEFSKEKIYFNGCESDGLDYETFYMDRNDLDWSFCKTNRKPYDFLVCLTLLAAKDFLNYEIDTDGSLIDWMPAIKFYLKNVYSELPDDEGMKIILPKKFKNENVLDKI